MALQAWRSATSASRLRISGSGRPLPVVGPAWRRRRSERRRIFGFCLSSDAKWVIGLPHPLERVLSRKNTVYNAFLGLGHVIHLLLESVLFTDDVLSLSSFEKSNGGSCCMDSFFTVVHCS